ncbi:PREDICTED: metalloproteinase inhibitor 2 [Charadrius vociferus]|uniref:metalloproteinase inhibitor 2 n=1 Tax=Charadrius vociferus TaxID=50402 RepID=UPI0005214211|nr:PREDICTED: metalloproteinase inhibitor 2 [Charadrius vociferus]
MHITLCDLVSTWDSLSPTQKKSLNQRYQMGCECKISRCLSIPCFVSSSDECLWTDWAMEKNNVDGRQAKHYACIKRSDGSCAWYRGMAPLIRAKAVSAKEVDSGNDIYGNPIKRIQYEIKQIKMFKGPDKDIEFIYTAPSTAVCGRLLDTGGKKEYLIAAIPTSQRRWRVPQSSCP